MSFTYWLDQQSIEDRQLGPSLKFIKGDTCWPRFGFRFKSFIDHLAEHEITSGPIVDGFSLAHQRYMKLQQQKEKK